MSDLTLHSQLRSTLTGSILIESVSRNGALSKGINFGSGHKNCRGLAVNYCVRSLGLDWVENAIVPGRASKVMRDITQTGKRSHGSSSSHRQKRDEPSRGLHRYWSAHTQTRLNRNEFGSCTKFRPCLPMHRRQRVPSVPETFYYWKFERAPTRTRTDGTAR